MNTETIIKKGIDGWQAKTDFDLGPATDDRGREGRRVLRITTSKSLNGKLTTSAYAHLEADGVTTYLIGGDFSKRLLSESGRCTQAAIKDQHARALSLAANSKLVDQVKAFYAAKEQKVAA